ncbi:MAG: 2-oxo acid dehydrogenase subunit E2 [Halobacteriovoraceae bacterium]|jgi:pyruvate dehydrogenase E2 component (dihydrolipoamide acetyltransferase)|nr:2-oxo acid dehydrogenase subunit E2 [Halobacteriovoraceae bacterium]
MAKQEIVMPQMGESITTGTITKWHKKAGDTVALDEIILEISTDKVESEIPSPFEGRVDAILFEEGETIDVGVKIAVIEDDLSAAASAPAAPAAKKEKAVEPAAAAPAPVAEPAVTVTTNGGTATVETGRRFYTPLVKAMAEEAGVSLSELANLKGSGAAGRVNKSDFENFLKSRGDQPVAPSAIKTPAAKTPAAKAPVFNSERVQVIPMDNMRKAIAKNMVQSKLTSPHVNSLDEIDMSHLWKFREGFKNQFKAQEGFSLTYTHFILYAIVQALKEFPMVNASVDGDNIVVKQDINLGCAVAVPGNGLIVPVIKGADGLNITGIARSVNELATKARSKKLTMDDLTGGTFTMTNVGSFGTLFATPVILQPQAGIFACGVIKKRPVVVQDDAIAVKSMMYATHTYDHRIVDGELGGRFLGSVKKHLETMDPTSLF